MTLHQLWGVLTPSEALERLKKVRLTFDNPTNLEDWITSQVGEEIYEIFIKHYTTKQWGKQPKDLPVEIIKRLPIRLDYNDRYFDDKYEGIPIGGYTKMIENILDHPNIQVRTNFDFFENRKELTPLAGRVVYTGKLDEYYDYKLGELEYRSLRFETKIFEGDYQGNALIMHPDANVDYTRTIEHKHFEFTNNKKTVVTWEYPQQYSLDQIPYYPINDTANNAKYQLYRELAAKEEKVIFGGRLGRYQYYNMDQIIAAALSNFEM